MERTQVDHVTLDDIAARAGVSRATVSMALRGSPKISVKRTDEIHRIARQMGYSPNVNASRLAGTTSSAFGVLLADLHNPIMSDIVDGFAPANEDEPPEMYLASGFNDVERERTSLDTFLAHRVAGIVLIGSRLAVAQIQHLAKTVPTVVVGRNIPGVDSVLVDDKSGGDLAAEHLLKLGHRRLAHLDGGTGAGAQLRKEAFLQRVASVKPAAVRVLLGNYTQSSGYAGAKELFASRDRPTAIFAANDSMALGVLGAARECHLMAGVDFALCGFDDIDIACYGYISLTTISYSRQEMGHVARRLLRDRIGDVNLPARTVELQPSLIVRGTSCSAPVAASADESPH